MNIETWLTCVVVALILTASPVLSGVLTVVHSMK